MDNLPTFVQSLPQELYDEICELVFTAEPGTRIVTPSYRPPHVLHVNRRSRQKFASAYFATDSIFEFDDARLLLKWCSKIGIHATSVYRVKCFDYRGPFEMTVPDPVKIPEELRRMARVEEVHEEMKKLDQEMQRLNEEMEVWVKKLDNEILFWKLLMYFFGIIAGWVALRMMLVG